MRLSEIDTPTLTRQPAEQPMAAGQGWTNRVPLAWQMLRHDPFRLLRSLAGIAFAVFLIFAEIGFLNGLYDNQVELIRQLDADLIITNTLKRTLSHNQPFARRRLQQARALPEVEGVYPLYTHFARSGWKNPDTKKKYPIRLLAFKPEDPVFSNPDIVALAGALKRPGDVLIDARSRPHFGRRETGLMTELSGKAVRVAGTFRLGADFVNAGTVIMSDQTFQMLLPAQSRSSSQLGKVEVGIVRLAPHTDPDNVANALRRILPNDVAVYPKSAYLLREQAHWRQHTPVGAIFGLGAAMGVCIGVMICYQVLYTEIIDHLPQFATLKAMGYSNRFLIGVVLRQSWMLSCFGFALGLGISSVFYRFLASQTGLLMYLTLPRSLLVFGLTVVMCMAAAGIAVRTVLAADPGEVF